MRYVRSTSIFLLILLTLPVWAQQSSTANPQGPTLLQQSLTKLTGNTSVADVTLTGTARRIAGSDDETGTVVLQALATGQSQIKCTYPSGPRSELTSTSNGVSSGTWTGPDGVAHPMSYHNLLTDSSWFFPALTLSKLLASQATVVTPVGRQTKNGTAVTHLTAVQQFAQLPPDAAAQLQHISQMDLFLDATTLLPVALDLNVHPDNNMLLDIPVEVRFSDYRAVGGVQVPFHVQKYLNNSLVLDTQLQAVTLNSGLAASAFVIQ